MEGVRSVSVLEAVTCLSLNDSTSLTEKLSGLGVFLLMSQNLS